MQIIGLKEAVENLGELDRKVQKQIVRKGLRAGAKVSLAAARSDAPELSGKTRRNCKIRSGKSGNGKTSLTVGIGAKDFQGEAFYASFVLYGWKHGSRKLGDARKQIPANNWLLRAYDETKDQAAQKAIDTLIELVNEASNKV